MGTALLGDGIVASCTLVLRTEGLGCVRSGFWVLRFRSPSRNGEECLYSDKVGRNRYGIHSLSKEAMVPGS